jgi:hypothetical protein
MMKVCTQAGLSSNEHKLFIPAKAFFKLDVRDGLASRDEAGDSGGEGSRESVFFLPGTPRPASSA